MRHDKGAFYNETIEPGSYQLSGLGGRGKGFLIFASNDIYKFTFPAQAEGIRASQAGKLYYIGSYKLMSKGDLFSQTYYIVPSKSPTPKEILEMILPHAKGNQWEPLIERRIKELSQ
jgi:hypothetical protein